MRLVTTCITNHHTAACTIGVRYFCMLRRSGHGLLFLDVFYRAFHHRHAYAHKLTQAATQNPIERRDTSKPGLGIKGGNDLQRFLYMSAGAIRLRLSAAPLKQGCRPSAWNRYVRLSAIVRPRGISCYCRNPHEPSNHSPKENITRSSAAKFGSAGEDPCLVQSDYLNSTWVALSYVWSERGQTFVTTKNLLDRMNMIPLAEMPITFRDALIFGQPQIPYLRIGALCVLPG
jgi:hypothetical protein